MFISQEPGNCQQEPGNCHMQKKDGSVALLEMKIGQRKSIFGPYGDLDMLSWMRSAALDPSFHSSTQNLQKMHKQIHRVRKFMILSNSTAPQRKRKLDLFLKEESTSLKSSSQRRISKMKMSGPLPSFGSSVSSVINSVKSNGCFQQTLGSSHSSISSLTCEDNLDGNRIYSYLNVPVEDIFPVIDSNESAKGSKTSLGNLCPNFLPIVDFDEVARGSSSSNWEVQMNDYLKKPRRSIRLQNFVGDVIPSMVVPVGPRFQAHVPEWSGPSHKGKIPYDTKDSESLKWLGVQMWPIKTRNSESPVQRRFGRGRADSCSCTFPGSGDCIKLHVLEQRRNLKTSLGSAFYSMKFDEMGDEVSKSWSSIEQEKFKSFMKSATPSNRNGYWKNMFKCFSSKRSESIISYYFNVYVPRVMIPLPDRLLKQVDAEVGESDGTTATKYLQQKSKYKKFKGLKGPGKG